MDSPTCPKVWNYKKQINLYDAETERKTGAKKHRIHRDIANVSDNFLPNHTALFKEL